jgi:hypothetical protein
MPSSPRTNDVLELYAPKDVALQDRDSLAGQALGCLADAWKAMQALETSLPHELQRWDAESLMTARTGTQRAWLALSNLNRSLHAVQGSNCSCKDTA